MKTNLKKHIYKTQLEIEQWDGWDHLKLKFFKHDNNPDQMSWSWLNKAHKLPLSCLFPGIWNHNNVEKSQTKPTATAPSFWKTVSSSEDFLRPAVCAPLPKVDLASPLRTLSQEWVWYHCLLFPMWPSLALTGDWLGRHRWQTHQCFPAAKVTEISVHDTSHHSLICFQLDRLW